MEAKGLMVGNYLKKDGIIVKIDARSIFDMFNDNLKYEPIPLTEDWLVKFGYKRYESDGVVGFEYSNPEEKTVWYEKGRYSIVQWGSNTPFYFSSNLLRVELQYVHQLQNLYFAISGKELTI